MKKEATAVFETEIYTLRFVGGWEMDRSWALLGLSPFVKRSPCIRPPCLLQFPWLALSFSGCSDSPPWFEIALIFVQSLKPLGHAPVLPCPIQSALGLIFAGRDCDEGRRLPSRRPCVSQAPLSVRVLCGCVSGRRMRRRIAIGCV